MNKLLTGKTALVTGAAGIIGTEICLELAEAGANIVSTEISEKNLRSLEKAMKPYSVGFRSYVSDVSNPEESDALCDSLDREKINVDILVNNAALKNGSPLGESNFEEWRKTFDTNVLGPVYLTRQTSKMMIKRGTAGSVIFITSIHQWIIRRLPNYSASKAALGMIVKELALDLAPHHIRVNGIAPGYVASDREGKELSHRYTPLYKSSVHPRYIGRAAVYLAADYYSRFTTGAVLKIDAGLSLYDHLVDQMPPG